MNTISNFNSELFAPLGVLKVWADGFGIQLTKTQRDKLGHLHTPYNIYPHLLREVIIEQLDGLLLDSYHECLKQVIPATIEDVCKLVRETSFFTMTPAEVEAFIWGELYAVAFTEAYYYLHQQEHYLPSLLQMMGSNDSRHATAIALTHLDDDPEWRTFYQTLDKADKDKLWRWRNTELPNLSSLKALFNTAELTVATRQRFFTILLHARFLDSFKPKKDPKEQDEDTPATPAQLMFEGIRLRHLNRDTRIILPCTIDRTEQQKAEALWAYELLDGWHMAAKEAKNGNIESACKRCLQLLDVAPTLGPSEQDALIYFSLMIGAMKDKDGDAVLLRNAKNLGILFGSEQPHNHVDERTKQPHKERNDFVKQYEIEELQRDFNSLFPEAEVDYSHVQPENHVAYIGEPSFSLAKRKSKVGDSELRLEQLSQAIAYREYNKAKVLLKQTTNINFGNYTRGHTPLVIALQNYNDSKSEEDAKIVSLVLDKCELDPMAHKEVLQTRTDKYKITPLSLAIEANEPEFVRRLLELGADPSQRFSQRFIRPIDYVRQRLQLFHMSGDKQRAEQTTVIGQALMDAASEAV